MNSADHKDLDKQISESVKYVIAGDVYELPTGLQTEAANNCCRKGALK